MNKLALIAISGILLSLLTVVTLFLVTSESEFGESNKALADLGGDFTLNSASGTVSSNDYRGKVLVMYFGFTSCPSVCPNSMGVISSALNRLDESQLQDTQAFLISIDPKRASNLIASRQWRLLFRRLSVLAEILIVLLGKFSCHAESRH